MFRDVMEATALLLAALPACCIMAGGVDGVQLHAKSKENVTLQSERRRQESRRVSSRGAEAVRRKQEHCTYFAQNKQERRKEGRKAAGPGPAKRKMPSFANVHLPQWLAGPLQNSVNRLEFTLNPSISLKRLKHYTFTWRHDAQYLFLACLALANLATAQSPPLLGKIFIVAAYTTGLLIPLTSQFVLPATPIFSWLLNYWASRWTVALLKPHIWVSVLPTLESVLYGANISDILTRYTSSTLDILAWIPYGVLHFSLPFVCAALIWIFGP